MREQQGERVPSRVPVSAQLLERGDPLLRVPVSSSGITSEDCVRLFRCVVGKPFRQLF
jgi:hypothetical protein